MREADQKSAMIQWIVSANCSHALTLNFNREITLARGVALVGKLFAAIERERFGRDFVTIALEHRLVAFVFAEHVDSNLHFHIAMRFDAYWRGDQKEGRWSTFIDDRWRGLTSSGSTCLEAVISDDGWARYITKEFGHRRQDYWLAADFHSRRGRDAPG